MKYFKMSSSTPEHVTLGSADAGYQGEHKHNSFVLGLCHSVKRKLIPSLLWRHWNIFIWTLLNKLATFLIANNIIDHAGTPPVSPLTSPIHSSAGTGGLVEEIFLISWSFSSCFEWFINQRNARFEQKLELINLFVCECICCDSTIFN